MKHVHMRLLPENKSDLLLQNRPFLSANPETKFYFISPGMKSNVNRISFMVS